MELSLLLLQQIISMVLMALAGFVLGRAKLVTGEQSRVLSCICVYLVMPCSMIVSFSSKRDLNKLLGLGLGLVAGLLIHLLYLAINALLFQRKHGLTREEQASVIYNNAGNLVLPMVQSILGVDYLLYTAPYMLVQNILMWTHGQKLMGGEQKFSLKKIITTPVLVGVMVGLVLFVTGISLPGPLYTAMESMTNCLAPLSMLVTGIIMSELDLKEVFGHGRVYLVTSIRLVFLPVLSMGVLLLLHRLIPVNDSTNILTVSLLCAIGPSASTITQLAQLYRNPNAGYVSSINVLTTICCAVTMPLLTMLFLSLL
jgi:hypothetical protein